MKILSIETSCDETALSILEAKGTLKKPSFSILANEVASQIALHAQYGGVFPMMAKREHEKNLVPLLEKTLENSALLSQGVALKLDVEHILAREEELRPQLMAFLASHATPPIDAIAVTHGPGLEPALWVGVNFARALAAAWQVPIVAVNHM